MTVMDNFGKFIASHFFAQGSGSGLTWTDINGVTITSNMFSSNTVTKYNRTGNYLKRAQVGKGTTPPTRQDLTIESPFVGGVESGQVAVGVVGVNLGLAEVQAPTLITPTLNAGTITEAVYFLSWRSQTPTVATRQGLTFRNTGISSSFIAGESINLEHKVNY